MLPNWVVDQRAAPGEDAAPEALGIVWEYSCAVNGGRRIFIAEGETGAYADAYRRCRNELRALGFSYAEPYLGDDFTGTRPCFWLSAAGWSPAALDAAKALVPARIREAQERDARNLADWQARQDAPRLANESLIADARKAAARSLGTRRWSWVRPQDVEEAECLITDPALDVPGARRLLDMVKQAKNNVVRTEEPVAVPYEPELALARNPDVRVAAAEALAHVTAFDADRAAYRNDIGWSRATTLAGHVLTGMGELDEARASHTLRILRIHHGQVPPALLTRVLGAPAQVAA